MKQRLAPILFAEDDPEGKKGVSFTMLGEMTDLQARAFELLRVKLR